MLFKDLFFQLYTRQKALGSSAPIIIEVSFITFDTIVKELFRTNTEEVKFPVNNGFIEIFIYGIIVRCKQEELNV